MSGTERQNNNQNHTCQKTWIRHILSHDSLLKTTGNQRYRQLTELAQCREDRQRPSTKPVQGQST